MLNFFEMLLGEHFIIMVYAHTHALRYGKIQEVEIILFLFWIINFKFIKLVKNLSIIGI
jgi:hypothetical protein